MAKRWQQSCVACFVFAVSMWTIGAQQPAAAPSSGNSTACPAGALCLPDYDVVSSARIDGVGEGSCGSVSLPSLQACAKYCNDTASCSHFHWHTASNSNCPSGCYLRKQFSLMPLVPAGTACPAELQCPANYTANARSGMVIAGILPQAVKTLPGSAVLPACNSVVFPNHTISSAITASTASSSPAAAQPAAALSPANATANATAAAQGRTPAECCALCHDSAWCLAWTHLAVPNASCFLHDSYAAPGRGQLAPCSLSGRGGAGGVCALRPTAGLVLPGTRNEYGNCTAPDDTVHYFGSELLTYYPEYLSSSLNKSALSYGECCRACDSNPACLAFTVNGLPGDQTCELKWELGITVVTPQQLRPYLQSGLPRRAYLARPLRPFPLPSTEYEKDLTVSRFIIGDSYRDGTRVPNFKAVACSTDRLTAGASATNFSQLAELYSGARTFGYACNTFCPSQFLASDDPWMLGTLGNDTLAPWGYNVTSFTLTSTPQHSARRNTSCNYPGVSCPTSVWSERGVRGVTVRVGFNESSGGVYNPVCAQINSSSPLFRNTSQFDMITCSGDGTGGRLGAGLPGRFISLHFTGRGVPLAVCNLKVHGDTFTEEPQLQPITVLPPGSSSSEPSSLGKPKNTGVIAGAAAGGAAAILLAAFLLCCCCYRRRCAACLPGRKKQSRALEPADDSSYDNQMKAGVGRAVGYQPTELEADNSPLVQSQIGTPWTNRISDSMRYDLDPSTGRSTDLGSSAATINVSDHSAFVGGPLAAADASAAATAAAVGRTPWSRRATPGFAGAKRGGAPALAPDSSQPLSVDADRLSSDTLSYPRDSLPASTPDPTFSSMSTFIPPLRSNQGANPPRHPQSGSLPTSGASSGTGGSISGLGTSAGPSAGIAGIAGSGGGSKNPGGKARTRRSSSRGRRSASGSEADAFEWEIRAEQLEFCRHPDGSEFLLGSGGYGQVYKAIMNGINPVAVKIIMAAETPKQMESIPREVAILRACHDRNVVSLLGTCLDSRLMLVTEYCELGDLWHLIDNDDAGEFLWHRRGREVALDIARGLVYLHSKGIVHFDLKSPNVVLDAKHTAKIADVGLSKMLQRTQTLATAMGTFAWAAPEQILGQPCSEKADMWGFGIILWEIVTGEHPKGRSMRAVRAPEECPVEIDGLVRACTNPDQAQRPSAREAFAIIERSL